MFSSCPFKNPCIQQIFNDVKQNCMMQPDLIDLNFDFASKNLI